MWINNRKFIVENIFCAAALWGLWKLRNSVCFQGTLWMDRCASADTEGNSNAAQLEFSVSEGESRRISRSPGQTEKLRYKASPTTWLSQVNDKWDRVLYQAGTDWKINTVPDEAKALLTNGVDPKRIARKRKD
jgi:hypothetical protein